MSYCASAVAFFDTIVWDLRSCFNTLLSPTRHYLNTNAGFNSDVSAPTGLRLSQGRIVLKLLRRVRSRTTRKRQKKTGLFQLSVHGAFSDKT